MKEYILNEKLKTQVEQHSSHKEKIEYDLKKLEDYLLLLNDKIEILKKLLSEKQAVTTTKTQKELVDWKIELIKTEKEFKANQYVLTDTYLYYKNEFIPSLLKNKEVNLFEDTKGNLKVNSKNYNEEK